MGDSVQRRKMREALNGERAWDGPGRSMLLIARAGGHPSRPPRLPCRRAAAGFREVALRAPKPAGRVFALELREVFD